MRLLVLTHNYPRFPGDFSGTFIQSLCDALCAAGNEVLVLTPDDEAFGKEPPSQPSPAPQGRGQTSLSRETARSAVWAEVEGLGVGAKPEVITFRYLFPRRLQKFGYMRTMEADVQPRGRALLLAPLVLLFGTLAAWRLVRRRKPDLIHAHWVLPNGFVGALVSRLIHVPLVVSLPGSDVLMAGKNVLFNRMARFAWQTAALITTNSADLRAEAIRLGAPAAKFDLIVYGVDARAFVPCAEGTRDLRERLGLLPDDVVVLGVGRMVYKKGFDVLIRALSILRDLHPRVRVVLVGEGDLEQKWEALAQECGVAERVVFAGRVPHDQIARYYNMCDMLAMPSVTRPADGLNVCVVDAMSCAKPIVASRAAGNPLVVANGINGLLVDENDPAQLAHALARLAEAPALRAQMGAASRRRLEAEFDWAPLAGRYLAHFRQILSP